MKNLFSNHSSITRKSFVKNLERDEIRNGFLVTSHRKKLWNVQIGLINEFARICKKHNLRWFADSGTLLGAARHGGFIPWDDDVDLAMLRPDYNKFIKIAAKEINYPYFLDNWYDYQRERELTPSTPREANLQLVTEEVEKKYQVYWPFIPFLKFRDLRTTMIEIPEARDTHQCIWIDILPLDAVPPFSENEYLLRFLSSIFFFEATVHRENVKQWLQSGEVPIISDKELKMFLALPYRQRGILFDKFVEKNFANSEKVGRFWDWRVRNAFVEIHDKKIFERTVYLPFEEIKVPAPIGWEKFLENCYGDWRKMKKTHTHTQTYSADIPYSEYRKLI